MSQFEILDANPNEDTGGGGTLGSGETRSEDAQGPYVVFPATETASNVSPHAVLSYDEIVEIYEALADPVDTPVLDLPAEEVEEVPEV